MGSCRDMGKSGVTANEEEIAFSSDDMIEGKLPEIFREQVEIQGRECVLPTALLPGEHLRSLLETYIPSFPSMEPIPHPGE